MQANKVEAIYSLREAAEHKAQLQTRLEQQPSSANRDALLDAQIDLEAKTQDAIEVCHECGSEHAGNQPHGTSSGNVIDVDFGRADGRKNER